MAQRPAQNNLQGETLKFHPGLGVQPHVSGNQQFNYAKRRQARNILRRQNYHRFTECSADWVRKLAWARMVLPNYTQGKSAAAGGSARSPEKGAGKRQHSQENVGPSSKRSKMQPQRSYAEMSKECSLIGVIDRGSPEGSIPRNQWKLVEAALIEVCFEMLDTEPGPPPVCKDVGWYHGNIKIIACQDERSVKLYTAAVARVGEVYPGAKLQCLNWSELPSRPRARIWLPGTMREPDRILKMLQRCNPQLPTHDWRVIHVAAKSGSTIRAILILNKESLAPIEAAKGELNFGFVSATVRVYKSDLPKPVAPIDIPDVVPQIPTDNSYDISLLTRDMMAMGHGDDDTIREVEADVMGYDQEDDDLIGDIIDDLDPDISGMESLLQDFPETPPSL